MFNSTDACAETCESAPAEKCSIWLYSHRSKHCFWRLDGEWNPQAQSDVDSHGVLIFLAPRAIDARARSRALISSHSSRSDACPPRPPLQVSERKLQDQSPGTELGTSITVISTSVTNGRRTVVTTRALKGVSKDYYSFNASTSSKIDLINAVGSTPALSYHKAKVRFAPTRPNTYSAFRLCPHCLECASTTPAHLRLLSNSRERPANLPHHQGPTSISVLPIVLNGVDAAGTCVCNGAIVPFGSALGKLTYYPNTTQAGENGTVGSISFPNKCFPDLLWQKNPTCDLRTYVGGQSACHHMWSLLDADQEIPWVDTPLEYHMKFRFYVQPYNASYHTLVNEHTWGIASPVEYDVPKCDTGVLGCRKDPKSGRWIHTINGSYTGNGHLSAAHFHCHAPERHAGTDLRRVPCVRRHGQDRQQEHGRARLYYAAALHVGRRRVWP